MNKQIARRLMERLVECQKAIDAAEVAARDIPDPVARDAKRTKWRLDDAILSRLQWPSLAIFALLSLQVVVGPTRAQLDSLAEIRPRLG
jgi:hypothetical protein